MFSYLEGRIAEKDLNTLVLDVAGIGWQLTCSMNTLQQAPETGAVMKVFTVLSVREDGVELYGFASREERSMFRQLTQVSGIGPKSAVSILSSMPLRDLTKAIMDGDVTALSRAQGVGKKTAQRIALELKGKVNTTAATPSTQNTTVSNTSDIQNALLALGYSEREMLLAMKQVPKDCSVSDGIKMALKVLSKS